MSDTKASLIVLAVIAVVFGGLVYAFHTWDPFALKTPAVSEPAVAPPTSGIRDLKVTVIEIWRGNNLKYGELINLKCKDESGTVYWLGVPVRSRDTKIGVRVGCTAEVTVDFSTVASIFNDTESVSNPDGSVSVTSPEVTAYLVTKYKFLD